MSSMCLRLVHCATLAGPSSSATWPGSRSRTPATTVAKSLTTCCSRIPLPLLSSRLDASSVDPGRLGASPIVSGRLDASRIQPVQPVRPFQALLERPQKQPGVSTVDQAMVVSQAEVNVRTGLYPPLGVAIQLLLG